MPFISRRLLAALLGLTFLASAAHADPADKPAPPAGRERVDQLLLALNAPSLMQRMDAETELLKLGPTILPWLPGPDLLPNASVREAVRRIRLQLERKQALDSLEPSRVTLQGTLTTEELLSRLQSQTGNVVAFPQLSPEIRQRSVTIDLKGTPYWTAVETISRTLNLAVQPAASGGSLEWQPAAESPETLAKAVAVSGAFRVQVLSIAARPLVGSKDRELIRVRLAVAVEPRLRALFLHYASREFPLTDTKNDPLSPFTPDARYELPVANGGAWVEMNLDYLVPKEDQPDEIKLAGRFHVLAAAGSERFEFRDLNKARNVSRRAGGVVVSLHSVTGAEPADNAYDMRLRISIVYDVGGPAFESHRSWIYYNDAVLQTPDDERIDHEPEFQMERQSDGGVMLDYQFHGLKLPPARYRFVYTAPTLLVDVPVEFDLPAIRWNAARKTEPAK